MANPKKHKLGVFAAGEIPYSIQHKFQVNDAAIDLTNFNSYVYIVGPEGEGTGEGTVAIIDAANGLVQYTWDPADMVQIGLHQMLIWVEDGTNRFASDLIEYEVYDGPGPTPPES